MAQEAVDGLRKQRREPAAEVERAAPIAVRLVPVEREERPAIAPVSAPLLEELVVQDLTPVQRVDVEPR